MARAVLVGDFARRLRLRGLVQKAVDLARRVGIQHEELAEVRVRVTQQFEAILLGAGKRLLVPVNHARRILFQDALRGPVFEVPRGARVNVIAAGVGLVALAENDAHQVVGAGLQIALPHLRGDFVVRLGYQVLEGAGLGGVAEGLERKDVSHAEESSG